MRSATARHVRCIRAALRNETRRNAHVGASRERRAARRKRIMMGIDEAIGQVENLYRAVTGKDFPQSETPYAPIPAEQDPAAHVKEQMDRLLTALSEPTSQFAMHGN